MKEFDSLEKQICALIQKNQELSDQYSELITEKERLKKENDVLKLKLEEAENKLSGSKDQSGFDREAVLAAKDRDLIRKQIDEIVKVIDYHLSS
ncbi:MAG: hypothetical protein ACEPO8_01050 [Rhodothermaceae bacterium]